MTAVFRATGALRGALLVLFLVCVAGAGVNAQSLAGTDSAHEVDVRQIEALIETLESERARAGLVNELRALAEARRHAQPDDDRAMLHDAGEDTGMVARLTDRVMALGRDVVQTARLVGEAPHLVPWAERTFADPVERARWLVAAGKLALVVAAGLVAEWIAVLLLAGPRRRIETRERGRIPLRVVAVVGRVILELVPVAAFALVASLVLPLVEPREGAARAAFALIEAIVIARAALILVRAIMSPRTPSMRLLPVADENASYFYIWLRRFVGVGVYGYFLIEAGYHLGLPEAGYVVLLKLLGLLLTAMAIVVILQSRETVGAWIAGGGPDAANAGDAGEARRSAWSAVRQRIGDVWHVLAIVYMLALFAVWLLEVEGGFVFLARAVVGTVLAIAAARLAEALARRGLRHVLAVREDLRDQHPGIEHRANRYMPVVYGTARTFIWLIALIVITESWGLDSLAWLVSEQGRGVVATVVQIAIVVVGAILLLEFVSAAVERYLRRWEGVGPTTGRAARLRTLLPLARNALRIVTVVIVGLVVLSQLGVSTGPLLAGAGVIGLAIGFGSQKLVHDVINGVFLLLEDTVQIGDVVNAGGHIGVCEAITIRTITLRDLNGTVHTVPFSEVATIENLTKEFSYALMDVGVAYREDTDEVVEILQSVGEEMRADETYGPEIIEPLEVLGVNEFAASAVVIRVRLKTRPIKQWMVRREFNRRMKKAFDAAGIEIPFPHTTLYFGEKKKGDAPPAYVRVAQAIEQGAVDEASLDKARPADDAVEASSTDDSGGASAPDGAAPRKRADLPE